MHISSGFRRSLFFEVQPFFKCKHFSSAGSVIMTGSFTTGRFGFFNVGEGCWWKNVLLKKCKMTKNFQQHTFFAHISYQQLPKFFLHLRTGKYVKYAWVCRNCLIGLFVLLRKSSNHKILFRILFQFSSGSIREIFNEESYCRLWSRISVFYINLFIFN